MTQNADYVRAIAERKRAGIDNDQDESAAVKRYFDRYTTEAEAELDEIAGLFPLEFAEWCEDMEHGRRPAQIDGSDAES